MRLRRRNWGDGDFERLKDLREEDDYGMLDPFF